TGKSFSSYRTKTRKPRPFNTINIALNTDREQLYDRINLRVDQMIEAGLVDEVKSLLKYRHLNALQTVGYSEIFEYLDGKCSLEEAVKNIKQNTRRFAKRQITWFKKSEDIRWFDPTDYNNILNYLNQIVYFPSPGGQRN
ncbi:MAG: tRNA dimethylallyltransferase, partial [Pedobacter sp.]